MDDLAELIGESPAMVAVRSTVRRLLERQSDRRRLPPILILGETGTGKGLLAHALHRAGPRSGGPFVDVNCAAIPEHLLEAEMFGFERGAFTDARQAKPGLFQAAHRGTIFLDEVGLLPEALQSKLLKAIEERAVRRLGSTRSEPIDAWVVSATSVELGAAVRERRFREDLYQRLAVVALALPPLRERGDDIIALAEHFLALACDDYGVPGRHLTPAARGALQAYGWPGNVRELANVMERVALLTDAAAVTAEALGLPAPAPVAPVATDATGGTERPRAKPLEDAMASVERQHVLAALEETGWNVTHAAAKLGISRDTLRYRIEKHGLRPDDATTRRRRRPATGASPRPAETPSTPAEPEPGATTATSPRELRRIVLLRADLDLSSGVTSPSGATRLLDRLADKARSFGGDAAVDATGITAAFGLDPLEDPPRRAVNAALAMRRAVARESHDAGLMVRAAVRSCEVTAGEDVATIDGGAWREASERSRAMLATTEAGAIVVDASVAASLQRRFELMPIEGLDQRLYRIAGHERTGFEVSARMSPLVGRRKELALLEHRFAEAAAGHGQVVGIVGEPGIGKSRLVFELARSLREQPVTVLQGHCQPHGLIVPYLPVLDVVRQAFGVVEGDEADTVAARLTAGVEALGVERDASLPYLLHLLDAPGAADRLAPLSPEAIRVRTFETLRRLALRSSRERPLVLVLEDLQWIDRTSEDWIASLVEDIASASILCLVTYRSGYRPRWIERSYATQLSLGPLSPEEGMAVVRSVLPATPPDEDQLPSLLDRAEGNPFFLEELAWSLAEHAVDAGAVPASIQGLLRARIDRLAAEPRRLLQIASVLGRRVPRGLLTALWPGAADSALRELARLEFLHDEGRGDEPIYAFKHALTQEVAYETLALSERQALHAAAACAIEARHGARVDDVLDRLAYHYARSDRADLAVDYLTRFAARAAEGYGHVEAATALREAHAHVERADARERDRRHLELALRLVSSLNFLGRFQEIVAVLGEHRERVERLGDPALAGPCHFWLARTWVMLGEPVRAVEHARRALSEAARAGDRATAGQACYVLAYESFWSGRPAEGVEHGREAVAHLEAAGERWWLAHAHWAVGVNFGLLGEFERAFDAGAAGLAIGEALGDPRLQSLIVATRGGFRALVGDWDAAIDDCRRGLDHARDPVTATIASGLLGGAHLEKGEAAAAMPLLERSVEAYARFGVQQTQGWFTTLLGEAWLLRGDLDRAQSLAREGLAIAEASRYRYGIGYGQRALGRVAVARADVAGADARLGEARATFAAIGARYEVARTALDLARLAHLRGDRGGLTSHLAAAHDTFADLGLPRWVEQTRTLASSLGAPLPC